MSSTKKNILSRIHYIFLFPVFLATFTVMGGWFFHNVTIIQIRPNMSPMVFNTALSFTVLSLSLFFSETRWRILTKILAVPAILIGALTLIQYLWGVSLGIDNFFVEPFYDVGVAFPGRMAISTATCIFILGWLSYLKGPGYKYQILCFAGASLVFGFSFISVIGYLFGFNAEYGWGSLSKMAFHTSLSFILLAFFNIWQTHQMIYSQSSKRGRALVPLYVVVIGVLSTIVIWQSLIFRDQERNRGVFQVRAESLKVSLDNAFLPLQKALEHMARRFSKGAYSEEEMWTVDAESYFVEFVGLKRLIWADPEGIARWVYPLHNGGREIVNTNFRNKDTDEYIRKQMAGEFKPFISRVYELKSGGVGFVLWVPVFKEGIYKGHLSAAVLARPFFEEVLNLQGFDLKITEEGQIIHVVGEPDPVFAKDWAARTHYSTLGLNLDLVLVPRPELVRENTSALPGIVLVFGVSVSVLLGVALVFFNRSQEAEWAAREAYEIKEAGMNSIPLLIISFDENAMVREMNTTAQKVLEYTNVEVAGKASPLLFHDMNEVHNVQLKMEKELGHPVSLGLEYVTSFFRMGYNKASEWTLISKSGKRYTVVMSASVIYHESGRVAGYLQIMEDVTLLREKEKLLKEQEQKIASSSRMASLGEMAAGIAHEINNPLAIIGGHVSVLRKKIIQRGLADDVEIMKKVDVIDSVVHRIAKIIKGLRSYAREPDMGGKEWVSAETIIEDTLVFCSEKFRLEGVQVTVHIESGIQLYVRHYQISQVLLNLLNNASDAVSGAVEKKISLEVCRSNGGIELSVSDSGPGVPVGLRTKIMEPFFTTKEVGKGVGLGLSISQGIVQSHDGKISIDDSASGARFVVWLPEVSKDSKPSQL